MVRQRVLIPSFGGSNPSTPAFEMIINKKYMFLLLLFLFVVFISYYISREIGKTPSNETLKKYEKLNYFYNNSFHNIYKSINIYKDIEHIEKYEKINNDGMFKMFIKSKIETIKYRKYQKKYKQTNIEKPNFKGEPSSCSIYWLGHSNTIIELYGKRIIIDPVFDNGMPFLFISLKWQKQPINREKLPKIDFVLITHNHYDHLERKTIQVLNKKNVFFIVPLGVGETLKYWGVKEENFIELGWQETYKNNNIIFTAEPAIHFTNRWLFDGNKTLWNSYVIQSIDTKTNNINKQIFCAGDGGYGEQINYIANKYKYFDIMIMEIDAWNTKWPYIHMFPKEVIISAKQLNTKYILPVHYAIFPLGMHKYDTSIKMIKDYAKQENIYEKLLIPKMGEKIVF